MVVFPRIIGHEVAATIEAGGEELAGGTPVTLSPYTSCGVCSSCLRGRTNVCATNQTLGVQRDGAMAEYISVPRANLYPANLSFTRVVSGGAANSWLSRCFSRPRRRH